MCTGKVLFLSEAPKSQRGRGADVPGTATGLPLGATFARSTGNAQVTSENTSVNKKYINNSGTAVHVPGRQLVGLIQLKKNHPFY